MSVRIEEPHGRLYLELSCKFQGWLGVGWNFFSAGLECFNISSFALRSRRVWKVEIVRVVKSITYYSSKDSSWREDNEFEYNKKISHYKIFRTVKKHRKIVILNRMLSRSIFLTTDSSSSSENASRTSFLGDLTTIFLRKIVLCTPASAEPAEWLSWETPGSSPLECQTLLLFLEHC